MNGQNTFGVDVLEGVPEVYGLFNGGVTLVSELSVFILKVCDKQVKLSVVHFISFPISAAARTMARRVAAYGHCSNGQRTRSLSIV